MSGDVRDPRFFDHDDFTGITEHFIYNPEDDSFSIKTQQENESQILEYNAELRKGSRERFGEWDRVAHVPAVVMAQLKRDGILDDPARYRKWLNDSSNKMFRTREGKV